jgi:epoxyqueuosine reductase
MQPSTPPPPADLPQIAASIKAEAVRLGFSRIGIAAAGEPPSHDRFRSWLGQGLAGPMQAWLERHEPLRRSLDAILPGARSVVMLATDHATLAPAESGVAPGQGRGRVARYAWGDDYHDLLRRRLNTLSTWLEEAVPGCRARGVVDSAPLAERDFGWLAGLGWFGKNTMLIDPRAGSWFFLSALVSDIPLPGDEPLRVDHCGTCTACLDACPTGAFVESRVLDAARCISALTVESQATVRADLRAGMGDWIFGCDVCQEVCPWNRHAPGSSEPAFQPRGGEASLSLADLLGLDEQAFRRRFKGSAIKRAKRTGLLRSAAIALGNHPDPASFTALAAAVADADPVIRGAAAWALGRWARADVCGNAAREQLAARLVVENDANVRLEIEAALAIQSHEAVSSTSAAGSRPGPSSR